MTTTDSTRKMNFHGQKKLWREEQRAHTVTKWSHFLNGR